MNRLNDFDLKFDLTSKVNSSLPSTGKNQRQQFFVALFLILSFCCGNSYGQQAIQSENNYSASVSGKTLFIKKPFTPFFIENKGQFNQYATSKPVADLKIPVYGSQMGNAIVLFTKNSIQFVENVSKHEEEGKEEKKSHKEEERKFFTRRQGLTFLNSNPDAIFSAEQSQQQYFTYPDPSIKNGTITARAWNKLICKNIYAGIDVEYSFKEEGGIKYSFIVHPGAEVSLIQMKWNGVSDLTIDKSGNLKMNSENGIITDHSPSSFYETSNTEIATKFILNRKTVSFDLAEYDHTQTLLIDPWVFSPNFAGTNKAYDIQHDPAGNIYVYGGANPYQLQKYTSLGAPIWTYNTSAAGYYGDFMVDATGNAFCIYGPWGDQCIKLTPAGILVWSVNSGLPSRETYRVYLNPVSGQLTIMGMEMPGGVQTPMVLNVDPNTGAYSTSFLHPTCTAGETRCMSVDANGDAFGIVFATVSSTNTLADNLIWKVNSANVTTGSVVDGYNLGETNQSNTDSWYSGFNGTTLGCFLYTYDGMTVKKWDKTTLALLGNVAIPGGIAYVTGGLCTDVCGNVYVGGPSGIFEFDSNLAPITSVPTTGQVYDVNNGNIPGEIIACGDAFFGSFSFPVTACTATLQVQGQVTNASCTIPTGSATVTVTGGTAPYTINWNTTPVQTGSVVTNLGPGTYTATITDNSCVKQTATYTLTITQSGGVAVTPVVTNIKCNGGNNGAISITNTGTVVPTYTWSPGGSNASNISNLVAGTYTVIISSSSGCNMTMALTVTQPPVLTNTITAGTIKCFGDTTSISVAVSGGTPSHTAPTYTVAWNPPNVQGFAVHGLGIGNYGGFAVDSLGCISTFTASLTQPPQITPNFTFTPACFGSAMQFTDQSNGGPFTWSWNFGDGSALNTTQNPSHTYAVTGNYTVALTIKNAANCSTTVTNTLNVAPGPIAYFRGDTVAGCPVHKVNFKDSSTTVSGQIVTWVWNFGNGNTYTGQFPPAAISYNNTSPTISSNYTVSLTVTSNNGCSSTVVKNNYITVYPHPQPGFTFASDDGSIIDVLNNNVHFYDHSLGATGVNYYLGDIYANPFSVNYTNNHNPMHQYQFGDPYIYYVTQWVKNQYGCKDSITEPLPVKPVFTFFIPNSFSPNGDGVNEYFKGTGIGIDNTTYNMLVFDRWGNEIFKSNDLEKGWDGRFKATGDVVMEDIYVWKVSFKDSEGMKHEYRGVVSIVK